VDVVVVGIVSLWVLILRWRERISIEAATLVMIGLAFAISSRQCLMKCLSLLFHSSNPDVSNA
jgi:hypothetical protein